MTPESLAGSATVKFVLDALAKAGCPVTRSFFTVESCDAKVVGGFRPGDGVRIDGGEKWAALIAREHSPAPRVH
jgi:hypothetical protein